MTQTKMQERNKLHNVTGGQAAEPSKKETRQAGGAAHPHQVVATPTGTGKHTTSAYGGKG